MPWHHKLHRGGALGARLLADIGGTDSAIANLSQDLTINGQTVSPTFRYEAKNATTGLWTATVGENLTGQGSGGTVGLDTPFINTVDKAVNGDATRYWEATTGITAGTQDFIVEAVVFLPAVATVYEGIFGTRIAGQGIHLRRSVSTSSWQFYTAGSSGARNVTASGTNGAWQHLFAVFDNDGSSILYVDGIPGSSASTAVGTITDTTVPTVAQYGASNIQISYLAAWYQDAWLDTHLQAAVAEERFARLTGAYSSQLSTGPVQANLRNSVATLEKQGASGGQKLFTVGPRWPRLETRPDKHLRYASGFNCEGQHTNIILRSQEFDNSSWLTAFSTITANTTEAPDGTMTADTLAEDGTAGQRHGRQQVVTQSGATYNFSCYVKPANRTWVRLFWSSSTDGTADAYFDVASGVVGSTSNADDSWMQYMGSGWYRCWVTVTRVTAEASTLIIYAAEADGDDIFTGLSQDSLYLWGAQVTETAYPVSYIKTEGATVTRLADDIQYDGLTLNEVGSVAADTLKPTADTPNCRYVSLSANGDINNRVLLYSISTLTGAYIQTPAGIQVNAVDTVMIANKWQEMRMTYQTNDTRVYVDGTQTAADSVCAMPVGKNRIDLGGGTSALLELDGLVRVRLYSKPTTKDVSDFGEIMARASGYISTPAGVSTSTSYVNVGGTWTSVSLTDFTMSAAGVFTYTGADTTRFEVIGAVSGAKSGGGSTEVTTAIEKNGVAVTASEITRDVTGSTIGAWPVVADLELANGDTVNFACKLDAGTETITIDKLSVGIFEG